MTWRRRLGAGRARAASTAAVGVLVMLLVASAIGTERLASQLGSVNRKNASLFDAIVTIADPGHRMVPLRGEAAEKGALYYVADGSECLITANLPAPQDAYQVSFIDVDRIWHAGTVDLEDGLAMVPCRIATSGWDAVTLTDEPPSRSPSPLVSPVLSGDLSGE